MIVLPNKSDAFKKRECFEKTPLFNKFVILISIQIRIKQATNFRKIQSLSGRKQVRIP